MYDKLEVDNTNNLLYNLENCNTSFNNLHNIFFSQQNILDLENNVNNYISGKINTRTIPINYQRSLTRIMQFVYNENNRLNSNNINEKINYLNNDVLSKLIPIIDEELIAYRTYINKFDRVTLPIELPKQSKLYKQIIPKNNFL